MGFFKKLFSGGGYFTPPAMRGAPGFLDGHDGSHATIYEPPMEGFPTSIRFDDGSGFDVYDPPMPGYSYIIEEVGGPLKSLFDDRDDD